MHINLDDPLTVFYLAGTVLVAILAFIGFIGYPTFPRKKKHQ